MATTIDPWYAIPVVVSVVGHRDLRKDSIDAIKESVTRILKGIQSFTKMEDIEDKGRSLQFPNPEGVTPFVLLSSLAEGADRLVAELALACGYRLGAILPMLKEDFEKDFQTEESVNQFRKLLDRASFVHDVTPGDKKNFINPEARRKCYERAGVYLCRQSQFMVALWDGIDGPAVDKCGTAASVHRQVTGDAPLVDKDEETGRPRLIDRNAPGPVFHVVSPRRTTAFVDGKPGEIKLLLPADIEKGEESRNKELARWNRVPVEIDRFNSKAAKFLEQPNAEEKLKKRQVALSCDRLARTKGCDLLPVSSAGNEIARRTKDVHSLAGVLSLQGQVTRQALLWKILLTSLTAVGLENLYSNTLWIAPWDLLFAIFVFGFAYILFRKIEGDQLEWQYIECRGLSEALRVQFFWQVAGLKDRVSDHYLRSQRDILEWIRQAAINTLLPVKGHSKETHFQLDPDGVRYARDRWLQGQRKFFGDRIGKFGKYVKRWNRSVAVLSISVGLLVVMTFVVHISVRYGWLNSEWSGTVSWMQFSYTMLLALAASAKAYLMTKAYEEDMERYEVSRIVFDIACRRIDEGTEDRQALFDVGLEALQECGEWLNRHGDRKVQPPG